MHHFHEDAETWRAQLTVMDRLRSEVVYLRAVALGSMVMNLALGAALLIREVLR